MSRDDATNRQVTAARPDASTWLAANAGSGKTRVLTDRVARLLLQGVQPQHILCLTYTKAAASEMQNRLFKRLGQWAMMPDSELINQLLDLGATGPISAVEIRDARTLFARAIEAPGGLKIQTIHSFCSSLLRRFPLEAGVSPQFSEIEERAAALLRAELVQTMADGPQASLVEGLAQHLTDADFVSITAEIVRNKTAFGPQSDGLDIPGLFGLPASLTRADLPATALIGTEADLLKTVVPILAQHSATMITLAEKLGALDLSAPTYGDLCVLYDAFLGRDGNDYKPEAKTKSIPTKKAGEAIGIHLAPFHAFMERVAATRDTELALMAAEKTTALYRFARAFVPAYEAQKQRRGWLDFDDLILKARDLLTDPRVAAWVLYRLDGGIDHILVDEAQDTSPVQWSVIERLAQEFTSGEGARSDIQRTIFVVGDKKQSIYSFQGADPREFDRMQAEFAARLTDTPTPLQQMVLQYSFRSSRAILDLVDHTFVGRESSGFVAGQDHLAFKSALPGRVDLWPVVDKIETSEDRDWYDPVDQLGQNHHSVVLARKIAGEIDRMITQKITIPAENDESGGYHANPIQPGDILVLVQRRSELFQEIIRECKKLNLPIAGADRLKVGAEMAVKDLAALLSFLSLPEDNLSLAVALKSPIFGWTEAMLYDLAHKRSQTYLWAALRDRADEFGKTVETLQDLRQSADFLRPFDLIERILTRHGGRRALLSRLGPEAEDGIDALLSQALAYERGSVPSLTGFLLWMETDNLEIKRQMGSAGNRIRVMTVHGAKGLESPIVILPDTGKRDVQVKDDLLPTADGVLWNTRAILSPAAIRQVKSDMADALEAERDRLLYVAMTRAEKWLIVAAAGDLDSAGNSWHAKIAAGLALCQAQPHLFPTGQGLRVETDNWAKLETILEPPAQEMQVSLESFFGRPVVTPPEAEKTLSPSRLEGAKALAGALGQEEDAAKTRGSRIHKLLEVLPDSPPEEWSRVAQVTLSHGLDIISDGEITELLNEAKQVLTNPLLAPLFTPDTISEVTISATIPALENRRIHGIIDKLAISPTKIQAIDFKTNAVVPDSAKTCPPGILRQMGAYALALGQIYPNHTIETAILWTRTAELMMLPHDVVVEALETTQIS